VEVGWKVDIWQRKCIYYRDEKEEQNDRDKGSIRTVKNIMAYITIYHSFTFIDIWYVEVETEIVKGGCRLRRRWDREISLSLERYRLRFRNWVKFEMEGNINLRPGDGVGGKSDSGWRGAGETLAYFQVLQWAAWKEKLKIFVHYAHFYQLLNCKTLNSSSNSSTTVDKGRKLKNWTKNLYKPFIIFYITINM